METLASPRPEVPVQLFDHCLGPSLLTPFAQDMGRRLARLGNGPLLELAAGTGVLTRAITASLPPGIAIIATDADAALVQAATLNANQTRLSWRQAEPAALPFPDNSFRIIACQFGLATMPDRANVLRQARRVMLPGGRFVFNVPGALRANPVPACVHEALRARYPADAPMFLAEGLHGYADDEVIDDDLTAAGFTDAMYTSVDLPLTEEVKVLASGYCEGTPLRREIGQRDPGGLAAAVTAVEHALRERFGSDTVRSCARSLVISASA